MHPLEKLYSGYFLSYINHEVREIVVNKPGEIGIEFVDGKWQFFNDKNLDLIFLNGFAKYYSMNGGVQFDYDNRPFSSFEITGGHRVQIVAGANAKHKFAMSLRVNHKKIYSLYDYKLSIGKNEKNDISDSDENIILQLTKDLSNGKTILVSGGTGSGKTSFLNSLMALSDLNERIVSIEGVPELNLKHNNWCSLLYSESDDRLEKIGIRELLNYSLRMRPDRIIIGEIRSDNAEIFLRSINTGHKGAIATIHANSAQDAVSALIENLMIGGGHGKTGSDYEMIYSRVKTRIHSVVHLKKSSSGEINISEYVKL